MQAEYKVVFNRKKKLNSKGKALIQIEVYLDGNRKYFSTDIYITPQEWKPSPLKAKYWTVYPTLKNALFRPNTRPKYLDLCVEKEEIKNSIFQHPEFTAFGQEMNAIFEQWKNQTATYVKTLDKGLHPKQEIRFISENLLKQYTDKQLTDKYAMYQHQMDYWFETMQDDMYELAADGWSAGNEVKRLIKSTKKGDKITEKPIAGIEGLEGRLIPPSLMIQEYLAKEKNALDDLETLLETLVANMDELREEQGGDEGLLINAIDEKGKISQKSLKSAFKEIGIPNAYTQEEYDMLQKYQKLMEQEAATKTKIKVAKDDLEKKVIAQYPKLSIDEIKTVVVDQKWMYAMETRIRTEMDNISHRLTQRIKELAERYETPLPILSDDISILEQKVNTHLEKMGFTWK